MAILAIDTSMAACSVALLKAGQGTPIQNFEPMARGHAEDVFPMIEAVMAEADCDFNDLSKIAVTLGPGSFTGVRAGIATARGLALATHVPLAGVSSLAVMARGCVRRLAALQVEGAFAIAHDARRNEIYVQAFGADGESLSEAQLLPSENALETLPTGITLIAGSGAAALISEGAKQDRRLVAVLPNLLPEAADLALIAVTMEPQDRPPAPIYLRPPDAKPQTGKILARAR